MDAIKWLCTFLKGHWGKIILSAIFTVLHVVAIFVTPYISGYLIDSIVSGEMFSGDTKRILTIAVTFLIGGSLIRQLTWYIRQLVMEWVAQTTVMNIRGTLFERLQKLDFGFFSNNRTGDLMARMTGDMDAIRMVIANTFPYFLQQLLVFVIGVFTVFFVSPILGCSLMILVPGIVFLVFKMAKTNKPIFIGMREAMSRLNSMVEENISGNRVVKAYNKQIEEIKKFDEFNSGYSNAFMTFAHSYAKYYPLIHFLVQLFTVLVILVGGTVVIWGDATVGQLTTVNGILWCITDPILTMPGYINQTQQFFASSIKIRNLNSAEALVKDKAAIEIPKFDGKVTFKNVIFSFDDNKNLSADHKNDPVKENVRVLKYINFTANPGDTVAIIGPTGSGKTALVNLIPRFYDPLMGSVYIDGINVKDIKISALRKNIGIAMQDVFLFSDSIKENIAYGTPDATMEDIIRVAKAADAHDFISAMPDGYDTVVGERGVGLSGGQKQRIALARALLRDASILILDDTTSALDMETEHSIQETLKKNYKKMTTFVIAHRISSVKNADLILVMHNGRIIEWGKHDELVAQKGYYASVCDTQYGNINDATYEGDTTFDDFTFTKGGLK
ncbi:MAG: ABC transporter ATP-binding protein [Clostridia bacterium]|nr:ABC transporter ATP-binding protein [Clostridia bacterium]